MTTARKVVIAVAVLLAAGGYAAWLSLNERTDAPASTLSERPECGHTWADSVTVEQVDDIIDVPEFHDCQRFIVPDGAGFKYDSLFAIFVSEEIGALEARLGPTLPEPVVVPPGTTTASGTSPLNPPSVASLIAGMVAVVYAEGPYPSLGIETGLNCLYVWRFLERVSAAEKWSARMVPKGTAKSCPDATVGTIGPGKDLLVNRAQPGGFTNDADYPPVTRWDWDATNKEQYVGIKCGAAWCEIYDTQLASSPPLPVSSNDPVEVRRVRLIKGWYDQQLVARYDADGQNPVPTGIVGTVVPVPDLAAKKDDDFEKGWVHVANISLQVSGGSESSALEKYKNKFNFIETPITTPVTLKLKGKKNQDKWKARIQRPGIVGVFTRKHKNVMRRPVTATFAANYEVPGVARWRWMTTDEGTWTRCTAGCCEMSDY